ncbi:MAG: DsbC family protein [Gammaproteobacteria bacterium]
MVTRTVNLKTVFMLLGALSLSAPLPAAQDELTAVRDTLRQLVPGQEPDGLKATAVPGIYEASYGTVVVYLNKDGRYLFQGDLIDLKTETNLSERTRAEARLKVIASLAEEDMIVFSPRQAKYTVTVFTDIDCTVCQRMHADMAKINQQGVKVRYVAYPRAGLDSESYVKAVSVWCSKDRKKAITRAKAGEEVRAKPCDNPVKQHLQAVRELGIRGTPAFILEDGSLIPGYDSVERLVETLEERKRNG